MSLNYSDLPGFQNLFLDYINEFENVNKFYPKNFRNDEDFLKTFSDLETYDRPHQKEISKIIKNQYLDFSISKQTKSNIAALESKDTFAVVTGQQVSLFGGPMYTIFKTITAIKLSNLLNEKYSDYNFVPIFWMEADDHDFAEVASTNILDKENTNTTLTYDDGLEEETNRGPVGNIEFNSNIKLSLADLSDALRDNEFKNDILALLNDSYKEGNTFKESFKNLLFNLFNEYGLIIFDPQDSSVKNLLLPIFEKEINEFQTHTTTNVLRSAELEEVYHAQVKVKPVNLFYTDESGRHLIEPTEDGFRFKGKRKRLNEEELLNLLYFDPTAFSPNVLLRPICQDFLLPTAVYVGGPSEISYFAQVIPNYSFFDVVSPILFPRSSATILESRQLSIINKYDLSNRCEILFSPVMGQMNPTIRESGDYKHALWDHLHIIADFQSIINKGNLAEIVAGLEIIRSSPSYSTPELYYWHRESRSSNAEIDYVISKNNTIIPIEVKAGTRGQMQSLHIFMKERDIKRGLRVSHENFADYEKISTLPLYAAGFIYKQFSI